GGITVFPYTTTTSLSSSLVSPNPPGQDPLFPVLNQQVKFTATVTPAPNGGTNQVQFFDGGSPLGFGTVVSGLATFTTTFTVPGVHNITAQYLGNGGAYLASPSSNTVVETVVSPTTTVLSASPPSSTTFGNTVVLTATVTAPGTIPPTTGNVT